MGLKKLLAILLFFSIFFITGCWDKTEIDDRAFVLGLAVDETDKTNQGPAEEKMNKLAPKDIEATFFMPIPSKLVGGQVDAFSSEKAKGINITDAIDNLRLNFNRDIFLGQIKIILIGEKVLKDPENFKKLLDFIERDPDMGRGALICAIKDGTDKLANIKPKFEKVFASYMKGIFDNASMISAQLSLPVNELLGEIRENKGSAVIPVISIEKDKAKCDDVVLVKNYKFLTYLDKQYLRPFSIMTNKLRDGDVQIPFNNKIVSVKITSCQTKLSLADTTNNPRYKIGVKLEGDIDNYSFDQDIFTKDEIKQISEKGKALIEKEMMDMIYYFQNALGEDYLMVGDYTKKYHYKFYESYSNKWNEEFKKAKFDMNIQLFIRRIGGTKK